MPIFNIRPAFPAGFIALVLFFTVFSSCSGLETFEKREITIGSRQGRVSIIAELAFTPAQHQQGLMHRTQLNDGEGMLFVFSREQKLSFWMKNTLIPLSIAYIASDGRIVEILDMEAGNLTPVLSSLPVRYALEVPQNWFSRAGIRPGDRLITEEL